MKSALPSSLCLGTAEAQCNALPAGVSLDLVYLDPPYSVGSTMSARESKGQARGRKRSNSGRDAYFDGGNIEALVGMLESCLGSIRERMSAHACLYLHLDHRAVHDVKMAADRVFGRPSFAGEVVWLPGNGSRGARGFSVTHQTILIYAKGGKSKMVYRHEDPLLREPYAAGSLKTHFRQVDGDGRRYRERTVNGKRYVYYADEGRRLGSVWTDIPAMVANTPLCAEATGYPTQKPEKLLERIIVASSHEHDTVADFMCGSGTTLAVASRLGRRFIGGDASNVAIEIARKRLDAQGAVYEFLDADPRPGGNAKREAKDEAASIAASEASPASARS